MQPVGQIEIPRGASRAEVLQLTDALNELWESDGAQVQRTRQMLGPIVDASLLVIVAADVGHAIVVDLLARLSEASGRPALRALRNIVWRRRDDGTSESTPATVAFPLTTDGRVRGVAHIAAHGECDPGDEELQRRIAQLPVAVLQATQRLEGRTEVRFRWEPERGDWTWA